MKKKILPLIFCFVIFAIANEPTETFDLNTGLPVSGTNWYYDAERYLDCQGKTGAHQGNPTEGIPSCEIHPRKDLPTLFVNDGANIKITGSSDVQKNIMVQVSGTAKITLENASIIRTGHSVFRAEPNGDEANHYVTVSPMQLSDGAHLTLTLVGDNTLAMESTQNARWSAGLGVPFGTSIVIEGDGKLTATGGISASGIGGHQGGVPGTHMGTPAGNITINSGTIIATGVELGSGIGNGSNLQGGTITINGGDITARGGSTTISSGLFGGGAGIGGGGSPDATQIGGAEKPYSVWCKPTTININGGIVRAFGGGASAGIGTGTGGLNTADITNTINITGGEVYAVGGNSANIGGGSAGIGNGFTAGGGSINISGGTVVATGGVYESNGSINLSNGFGAGIGSGSFTNKKTDFTMNGNAVVSVSGFENFQNPTTNNSTNTTLTNGILFDGEEGTVYGNVALSQDFTIPEEHILTIGDDANLTVDCDKEVIVLGEILGEYQISHDIDYIDKIDATCDVAGKEAGEKCQRDGCEYETGFAEIAQLTGDECNDDTPIIVVRKSDKSLFKSNIVSDKMEIMLDGKINFTVYDNTGNIVANGNGKTWKLRNSAGRFVANGSYLVIIECEENYYSAKLGVKR